MKKSIIKNAVELARKKLGVHPELLNFPHYSFVVENNKIVEWATNGAHEPSRKFGYHRKEDPLFKPKFHSEIWAYMRGRGLLKNDIFEMINIRFNRKGELKLSKPCPICYELLTELGCTKFYYSSEIGFLHT